MTGLRHELGDVRQDSRTISSRITSVNVRGDKARTDLDTFCLAKDIELSSEFAALQGLMHIAV